MLMNVCNTLLRYWLSGQNCRGGPLAGFKVALVRGVGTPKDLIGGQRFHEVFSRIIKDNGLLTLLTLY